jgi:hypothetical protein
VEADLGSENLSHISPRTSAQGEEVVRDIPLQKRITIQGLASAGGGVNQITQDEEDWIDTRGITELGAVIECSSITLPSGGTISLSIETAPTCDESLFVPIGPPIVFDGSAVTASTTPILFKTVRTPSYMAPAGLVRWKATVSSGSSGVWSLTFRVRLVPGRSRFFVPSDIPGNVGWFRSDMGITKDTSVPPLVSGWADQSGAANDMSQTGAARPTWVGNAINGFPAVNFDPSLGAQYIATGAFSLGTFTAILVTTGQNATNGWFWNRSTGATSKDTLYGSTNQTIYTERGGVVSAWDTTLGGSWGQWGSSVAKVLTVRFDGTHAGHKLRINGTESGLNNNVANDPGTSTSSDHFTLAARNDGVLGAHIQVAEFILYNRSLTDTELFVVEEYLRRRYALF